MVLRRLNDTSFGRRIESVNAFLLSRVAFSRACCLCRVSYFKIKFKLSHSAIR